MFHVEQKEVFNMNEQQTPPPPKAEKNPPVKARNWSFIAYPESLNPDWREQLHSLGLKGFVSPLHDKDVNEDGTPKKPHYHVTVIYGNTTTANSIYSSVCKPLGAGATHPIKCNSIEGSYDYATHEGYPDKAQYSRDDIDCFGGFDVIDYRRRVRSDDVCDMVTIHKIIRDNGLTEYYLLIDYLLGNGLDELAMYTFNHAYAFNTYCKSLRFCGSTKKGINDYEN